MAVSRRRFLQVLGAAGVTISANDWMLSRLEAYADTRLAYAEVRGPGLVSFSRSVCRDCANHCSLAVRKVDELPVGLRGTPWHPASRGALCVAGQSQLQALFDPDRLDKPLLRADAGAEGRVAEWDDALGVLRQQVAELVSKGHGERIAVVDGRTPSLGTRLVESWVRSIPGARYVSLRIEAAIDSVARQLLGGGRGGRLRLDLAHSGTLLLVGNELLEVDGSPVTQMREHGERREDPRLDHAPTLYLGPRQSPTAVQGDRWIPCHPGREYEILLSFAEALGQRHPERESILPEFARWVPEARDPVGFARRFSVENVAQRHGLRAEELEAAVGALEAHGPGVTLPGPGVLRGPQGFAVARAALALNLWTGGFRESGGLSWGRDPLEQVAESLGLAAADEHDPGSLSQMLKPLLEIKRSPVDVLLCIEANLVHELPGRDQIARALSHVPFLASFSSHEDETSRVAHVTIPTLLDLESWDLPAAAWAVPEASLQVQRPAVVSAVDARAVEDVFLDLAADGVAGAGFSPPAEDGRGLVEAAIHAIVGRGRGELAEAGARRPLAAKSPAAAVRSLLSGESVWVAAAEPGPMAEPADGGSANPPAPTPDLAPGQLWLVPFDAPAIQRGRILNRPMMMELSGLVHGLGWDSWVEIHPDDARARNIASGSQVRIRGPRAEIASRALVTRSITPGAVAAPVGFGHRDLGSVAEGRGANPLELPFAELDEETGAPAWGPIPVFIEKA
ncbi:MAG: molybdopterin dinucleotide binding domain-containing protein [Planctomycetota bacterium]|jgi:molybdopterin-containing oxidoreductase family iron-sulfur binding subunit